MKKLIFVLLALFIGQAYAQQGRPSTDFGSSLKIVVQFNRPANITTYADLDAVTNSASASTLIIFDRAARFNGGSGYVTGGVMAIDTPNVANGTFDLYLFDDSASVSVANDNAAYVQDSTHNVKRIGKLVFALATGGTGSTGAFAFEQNRNIAFTTKSYTNKIYGVLVARGAFVPKHTGRITIILNVERN